MNSWGRRYQLCSIKWREKNGRTWHREKTVFRFLKLKPKAKQTNKNWFPRWKDFAKTYGATFITYKEGILRLGKLYSIKFLTVYINCRQGFCICILLTLKSGKSFGQPLIQWEPEVFSFELNRPGSEDDQSPPSSAEFKNGGAMLSLPHKSLWNRS
jgi:hypothetical protein